MATPIYDLRSALAFLAEHGEIPEVVSERTSPELEMSAHYVANSAGVPASSTSRQEKMLMYETVAGHDIPVLFGVMGSRRRTHLLLSGGEGSHHGVFAKALGNKIAPQKLDTPPCQEHVICDDIDLTRDLPIPLLSSNDAGPYITLGFVFAQDKTTGDYSASVHRLCVISKDEMTISIYPGRQLGLLYDAALARGSSLAVSINIGLDPAIYYASCLTDPLRKKGDPKLDVVGGLRGSAVRISDCLYVDAQCISHAEIVIEAEILATKTVENQNDLSKGSMPEFTGYQGAIQPEQYIPVVKVKAITHRNSPIFQTVVGPGLEQSELQAITPEIASRGFLQGKMGLNIKDVVYTTSGGGLFMSIIQVVKRSQEDDKTIVKAALEILAMAPPFKHIYIVDEDVNPHSAEDIFWAMSTRFQADRDLHMLGSNTPFRMDPSQSPQYREDIANDHLSMKAVFDCSVPWHLKPNFKRPFVA